MSKFDTSIVDAISSTCDGDAKYNARYILTIYKQAAKPRPVTAIVILKNPASTCKDTIFFSTELDQIYDVDKTTTHVINTLFVKGIQTYYTFYNGKKKSNQLPTVSKAFYPIHGSKWEM